MRARNLVLAGVLLLGAVSPLRAAPFSKVPAGHWAYQECGRLASLGVLATDDVIGLCGDPQLTRFEFALALLNTLTRVDDAVTSTDSAADPEQMVDAVASALRFGPRSSEQEIAAAAEGLLRLSDEFREELRALDFEADRAVGALRTLTNADVVRAWRAEALTPVGAALSLAGTAASTDMLEVPFAHGTVALSVLGERAAPELLNYLARSAAALRPWATTSSAKAAPALVDPEISRLRTAYEYGVGSAVTLSLAYEEIARRGQGLDAVDAASLASVGVGYQLTSSTSVNLSYSLLEYSNYVLDTPRLRDRLAETAVSIEF
jgi:hypothetical protein